MEQSFALRDRGSQGNSCIMALWNWSGITKSLNSHGIGKYATLLSRLLLLQLLGELDQERGPEMEEL